MDSPELVAFGDTDFAECWGAEESQEEEQENFLNYLGWLGEQSVINLQ